MKSLINSQIIKLKRLPLSVDEDFYNIIVILKGNCFIKHFFTVEHYDAQDAVFINAGEVYSVFSDEECVIEKVSIAKSLLSEKRSLLRLVNSVGTMDQEKEISMIYRDVVFIKDILQSFLLINNKNKKEIDNLTDKLISALLIDYDAISYKDNHFRLLDQQLIERYYRIMDHIEQEYRNKLSLNDLAIEENMQKSNLASQFKQICGFTFLEQLNLYRLMLAEKMLLINEFKNSDIIEYCGFSDSKYFYRYFMELFNSTPANWKNQWIGKDSNYQVLDYHNGQIYIDQMNKQFDLINTNTDFYQQYSRLKELIEHHISLSNLKLELDLFNLGNLLVVENNTVNTWYGFDLIMNYVKDYDIDTTLKINIAHLDNHMLDDFINQLDRLIYRYGQKTIRNLKIEVKIDHPFDFDNAKWLEKQINKRISGIHYQIIC